MGCTPTEPVTEAGWRMDPPVSVPRARGAWWAAAGLTGAGLYLAYGSRQRPIVRSEPIGEADARAVLGVGPGATEDEIRKAWKRAMTRAHPDQGGTEGLAARVNAARDRLLRKGGARNGPRA